MWKRYAVSVMSIALVAAQASGADFAELQVVKGKPTLDIAVEGNVSGRIGWSAFALVNKNWAQLYAGPTFAPASWVQLGVSAGLESGGSRFAQFLWIGQGRFSALAIHESGVSGHWHKVVASAKIGGGFATGYHDQAFLGRGPHVAYTRGKVTAWSSLLINESNAGVIFAIRVKK